MAGLENIILLKNAKESIVSRVIREFGRGCGDLADMKLSILDVKTIVYDELGKIAHEVFKEKF